MVIFDVDNKDQGLGLSSPPVAFLESQVLAAVSDCLNPKGKKYQNVQIHIWYLNSNGIIF